MTAMARETDPVTSHQAAASVYVRESQVKVYALLTLGSATDGELFERAINADVLISESGLRTRRKEMVDLGYVRDSGRKVVLDSGRRSIIWEVNPAAGFPQGWSAG